MSVADPDFDEDARPLKWTAEGLYFAARHGVTSGLYRLDPATHATTLVALPGAESTNGFSFSGDDRRVPVYLWRR